MLLNKNIALISLFLTHSLSAAAEKAVTKEGVLKAKQARKETIISCLSGLPKDKAELVVTYYGWGVHDVLDTGFELVKTVKTYHVCELPHKFCSREGCVHAILRTLDVFPVLYGAKTSIDISGLGLESLKGLATAIQFRPETIDFLNASNNELTELGDSLVPFSKLLLIDVRKNSLLATPQQLVKAIIYREHHDHTTRTSNTL